MKKLFLIIAIILLYAPLVFGLPGARNKILLWDANTEPDLAGYFLYWRADGEIYSNSRRVDCGNVTSKPLEITGKVYLALTAYDISKNESEFSDEIFFSADQTPPGAPLGLKIVEE